MILNQKFQNIAYFVWKYTVFLICLSHLDLLKVETYKNKNLRQADNCNIHTCPGFYSM